MSKLGIERMIARRVRSGYNEQQSRELLSELLNRHASDNLAAALAYHGFTR